jgi:hypothetical protein
MPSAAHLLLDLGSVGVVLQLGVSAARRAGAAMAAEATAMQGPPQLVWAAHGEGQQAPAGSRNDANGSSSCAGMFMAPALAPALAPLLPRPFLMNRNLRVAAVGGCVAALAHIAVLNLMAWLLSSLAVSMQPVAATVQVSTPGWASRLSGNG